MTDQPSTPASQSVAPQAAASPDERRGFLAAMTAVVSGAAITLGPLIAGLIFAFDPVTRKRPKFEGGDADGFLPVVELSQLPESGDPVSFVIKADVIDAWNLFKDRTLGTVYLRRIDGAEPPVIAFTDVCPHLGCKVNYRSSSKTFFCPCHASTFELDGTKINKTPPRNLDKLAVKVVDGKVWVKYQDFRGGVAEQIAT